MLEANLKVIKCFRHAASKPVLDFPIADSVLKGLLKTKEAKSLFCRGLDLEMARGLIHNAVYEFVLDNFVGIRQAAIYALMY